MILQSAGLQRNNTDATLLFKILYFVALDDNGRIFAHICFRRIIAPPLIYTAFKVCKCPNTGKLPIFRNISESCSDQHHDGIVIRKCSDHASLQSIVRTQTCPMLIREVHIRQGLFDARFDKFSNLIQVHFPEFFGDKFCFLSSSFLVFLCMNRFQDCCNTFHMFPWTHRECIPTPKENTTQPLRIREKSV